MSLRSGQISRVPYIVRSITLEFREFVDGRTLQRWREPLWPCRSFLYSAGLFHGIVARLTLAFGSLLANGSIGSRVASVKFCIAGGTAGTP